MELSLISWTTHGYISVYTTQQLDSDAVLANKQHATWLPVISALHWVD